MANYNQRAARRRRRAAPLGTLMYYTYIIKCKDSTYYTGYTNDIARRVEQHNRGTAAKYTAPFTRRPVTLVFSHSFSSMGAAMSEEFRIKQLTRKDKEILIMSENNEYHEGEGSMAVTAVAVAQPVAVAAPAPVPEAKKITKLGRHRMVERDDTGPRYILPKHKSKSGLTRRFIGYMNHYDLYLYNVPGIGWVPRAVKESTAAHHGGIDLAIDIIERGRAENDNDLALAYAYAIGHNEGVPNFDIIPDGYEAFFSNYGDLVIQIPAKPLEPYTPSEEEKSKLKKQLDLMGDGVTRDVANAMGVYRVTKPGGKFVAFVEFISRAKWYNSQDHHKTMETYKALGYQIHDATKR